MLRNIRLLYIHNFLTDFCPQWPYLVIYFQPITGSYTSAMSVLALETLTAAFMDVPTGLFSDRIGRRFTMAIGSMSAALGVGLYASSHELFLLYAGAFCMGLSQCLFSGNNNALLYETLKAEGLEDQYHHYRGGTGSMYQLALCLSAFLAMYLSRFGLRFIFIVAVIPQVIAIAVSFMFDEPRVHVESKHTSITMLKHAVVNVCRNPRLMLLVAGKAISYGAGESSFKFTSAFINMVWPVWAVGLYRGLNHAIGFVGFQIGGRIVDRFKPLYIFAFRDIYWFVTHILAAVLQNVASPIIYMTGSVLFGPGEVASDHLMQKEFSDEQRATMGSLASFGSSIVFAISAFAIGFVSDQFGIIAGVIFGTFMSLMSLPFYLILFRKDI